MGNCGAKSPPASHSAAPVRQQAVPSRGRSAVQGQSQSQNANTTQQTISPESCELPQTSPRTDSKRRPKRRDTSPRSRKRRNSDPQSFSLTQGDAHSLQEPSSPSRDQTLLLLPSPPSRSKLTKRKSSRRTKRGSDVKTSSAFSAGEERLDCYIHGVSSYEVSTGTPSASPRSSDGSGFLAATQPHVPIKEVSETASASNMLEKIGPYKLLSTIGKGSYGSVVSATNLETGRKYALKIFDKSKLSKKQMNSHAWGEAAMLSMAKGHPHIIDLEEVCESKRFVHLVLEYFENGVNMETVIRKCPERLGLFQTKKCVERLADALLFLHVRGVAHRDVKPQNILLDLNSGEMKLLDFGFACRTDEKAELTEPCGSPHYVAPEVCAADASYNGFQADAWSLGATLFEMITTRTPFSVPKEDSVRKDPADGLTRKNTVTNFLKSTTGISLLERIGSATKSTFQSAKEKNDKEDRLNTTQTQRSLLAIPHLTADHDGLGLSSRSQGGKSTQGTSIGRAFLNGGDNVGRLLSMVQSGQYDSQHLRNHDADVVDLIANLLVVDPAERMTLAAVVDHPFLANVSPVESVVGAGSKEYIVELPLGRDAMGERYSCVSVEESKNGTIMFHTRSLLRLIKKGDREEVRKTLNESVIMEHAGGVLLSCVREVLEFEGEIYSISEMHGYAGDSLQERLDVGLEGIITGSERCVGYVANMIMSVALVHARGITHNSLSLSCFRHDPDSDCIVLTSFGNACRDERAEKLARADCLELGRCIETLFAHQDSLPPCVATAIAGLCAEECKRWSADHALVCLSPYYSDKLGGWSQVLRDSEYPCNTLIGGEILQDIIESLDSKRKKRKC